MVRSPPGLRKVARNDPQWSGLQMHSHSFLFREMNNQKPPKVRNKPRTASCHWQIPRVCRRGSGLGLINFQRGIAEDEHVAARGYGCSASKGHSMAKVFFFVAWQSHIKGTAPKPDTASSHQSGVRCINKPSCSYLSQKKSVNMLFFLLKET